MVSLGGDSRHPTGSGFFFAGEHSLTTSQDADDVLIDTTALTTSDIDPPVRKIKTIPYIIMELFWLASMEIAVFILPWYLGPDTKQSNGGVDGFSAVLYFRVALWFKFMIFERCLRHHHAISRRNGYLEFYRQTKNIRRVPFMVLSGGNAVLLVLAILLQNYCHKIVIDRVDFDGNCSSLHIRRVDLLRIAISIEMMVVCVSTVIYLVKTVKFNRRHAAPDVAQDEMLTSFLNSQANTSDIGFKDEDYLDEVLEKQADMIRYLKQHNAHLGKKILTLTQKLNQKTQKASVQ